MIQTPVPTGAIITCTFFSIGAWFGIRKQSLADLLAPKAIPLFLIWLPLIVYNVYWDGNRTDEGLILYPLMVMVGVFCIIALTARCLDGGQRRYSNHNRQSSHHTNRLKSQWSKLHDYAARNTFFIFAAHHCFGILLASVITNRLFALSSPEVCYTPWFWTLIYIAKPFLIIAICLAVLYVFQRFTPRLAGWLAGGR